MQEQIERAFLLLNQKRPKEAKLILMDCLGQEPDNDSILYLLAQVELIQEDDDKAMEYINSAIGLDPNEADYHLTKARVYINKKQYDEAIACLKTTLSLDPYSEMAYAFQSMIYARKKDFSMSLAFADKCLAVNPENLTGLNLRSTALLKLGREEESFLTIEGALNEDPEDPYTHANYGWGLLEKGEGKKSLEHFREALRLDPDNESARAGMAAALKANFFIYRWFLKYQFWMANQVARNQWIFIIGFYIAFRLLRSFADTNPEYSAITTPILVIAGIFAFSTWVMHPISNLILRLNRFGRHLLDDDEKKISTFVGLSLAVGIISGVVYFVTDNQVSLALAVFGLTMMLPLGRYYAESKTKNIFKIYTFGLIVLGAVAIAGVAITGDLVNKLSFGYLIAFVAYQWVANFQVISNE
jgi:tetratricopeptide (TPR) repeat protein